MKVLALRGISGSGKTSYAQELKAQGWAVVSRDLIREHAFHSYEAAEEEAVTYIEDHMIHALLKVGANVVIDDTNIRVKYIKRFAEIAAQHNADFDVKLIECDLNEAIRRVNERAATGGRNVPEDIIRKQDQGLKASRLDLAELLVPSFRPYVPPKDGIRAILVDIDGTLAHNPGHRGFYDYDKVEGDEAVEAVAEIVRRFYKDHRVIIMSGRDDNCQEATFRWLNSCNIPYDSLFMRKTGDSRKDSIVKMELFDTFVRQNYDVQFVLDDRQQVVDAWRSIGLRVFQVAPGNF